MNGPLDALASGLARALEPAEREAALGDLAEAGESGVRAALQIFGLAARRQAELWRDWRPWLAALGVTIPSVVILSGVAGRMSHLATIYGWLYLGNWDATYLTNAGARADLLRYCGVAAGYGLVAAIWSWDAGFSAGSLARRSVPAMGLLVFATLFGIESRSRGLAIGPTDAAFASLWGELIPIAGRLAIVLIPALAGLFSGAKLSVFRGQGPQRTYGGGVVRQLLLTSALASTMACDWLFRMYRMP